MKQELNLMQRPGLYFFFSRMKKLITMCAQVHRFTGSYGPKTQLRRGNADLCGTEGHKVKLSMDFQEPNCYENNKQCYISPSFQTAAGLSLNSKDEACRITYVP